MDFLAKMTQIEERFKNVQDAISQKTEAYNKEMTLFSDELKMLQGEYRLVLELGVEAGVIDPITRQAVTQQEPVPEQNEIITEQE